MKPLISIERVNFWYAQKQVLFSVSMPIEKNKITALIGPSGCGKTTLLRCLNRLNDLYSKARGEGEIFFGEQNVLDKQTDVVWLRKKVGMVFQKPNPFPMSIFDNVAYGLRVQREKNPKKIEETVHDSLKKAELWDEVKDRLSESAFKLSGGQQQRLCIARALAVKPDVLLLDEPCSALDPRATAKIEELIVKLKSEHTIVIVTHNLHQAKRIADYTGYLLNGELVEFGKTRQIFSKPKQKSTRDYIHGEFG